MKVKVEWVPSNEKPLMRQQINPQARQGHKPATLAYVRKHAQVSHYNVRWWEGETDTEGKWGSHKFPEKTNLSDVKRYAQMIASSVSQWEVGISLWGWYHGYLGWVVARVWTFGHYLRVGGGE